MDHHQYAHHCQPFLVMPLHCAAVSCACSLTATASAQVNEFHNAPNAFYFTSPLDSSVLPTLRVSGEAVLTEFGFQVGRLRSDVLMLVLTGALRR